MYSCNVGRGYFDLLLFGCAVCESRENVLCVEFFKGTDLVTVVGVRDEAVDGDALLAWTLANISSTWSERSALRSREMGILE